MSRQFSRLLFVLIAVLLLPACSAVRLGYGNADSLVRWWIDQYVDLSPEQDVLVRERLTRVFSWHRKTQLPDYVFVLRQGQRFISGQPTAGDALALNDAIVRRGLTLAEQATPDIAEFLMTVTPAQIDRMAARQAEKNADHAKEARLADGESEQRRARYKRWLEQAEYWFDSFSGEQKTALRRLIDNQPIGSQFWYDERLRRQREWLALARQVQRERLPRERVMQLLRDYATRFDMPTDAARLAQATSLRRTSAELAVAIHAMTTPAQRVHAGHKLGDLILDFTELSQETTAGS